MKTYILQYYCKNSIANINLKDDKHYPIEFITKNAASTIAKLLSQIPGYPNINYWQIKDSTGKTFHI